MVLFVETLSAPQRVQRFRPATVLGSPGAWLGVRGCWGSTQHNNDIGGGQQCLAAIITSLLTLWPAEIHTNTSYKRLIQASGWPGRERLGYYKT
ncbi:hypothetical protein PO909_004760 [Leuciscus waleckii]